jgi:hypothetical protein
MNSFTSKLKRTWPLPLIGFTLAISIHIVLSDTIDFWILLSALAGTFISCLLALFWAATQMPWGKPLKLGWFILPLSAWYGAHREIQLLQRQPAVYLSISDFEFSPRAREWIQSKIDDPAFKPRIRELHTALNPDEGSADIFDLSLSQNEKGYLILCNDCSSKRLVKSYLDLSLDLLMTLKSNSPEAPDLKIIERASSALKIEPYCGYDVARGILKGFIAAEFLMAIFLLIFNMHHIKPDRNPPPLP